MSIRPHYERVDVITSLSLPVPADWSTRLVWKHPSRDSGPDSFGQLFERFRHSRHAIGPGTVEQREPSRRQSCDPWAFLLRPEPSITEDVGTRTSFLQTNKREFPSRTPALARLLSPSLATMAFSFLTHQNRIVRCAYANHACGKAQGTGLSSSDLRLLRSIYSRSAMKSV
jgi:hypothetical protein